MPFGESSTVTMSRIDPKWCNVGTEITASTCGAANIDVHSGGEKFNDLYDGFQNEAELLHLLFYTNRSHTGWRLRL